MRSQSLITRQSIILLFVAVMSAQVPPPGPEPMPLNRDAIAAIEEVQGLEPQLAAYFLLRESERIPDKRTRRKLIEEALVLANLAPPHTLRYVGPPEATEEMLESNINVPRTDRLALQLKAVAAMAGVDADRAREVLTTILPTAPPARTCGVPVLVDLVPAYTDLKQLSRRLHARGERADYLLRLVQTTVSPLQLSGVLEVLNDDSIPAKDQLVLCASLTGALQRLTGNDPEFTIAILFDSVHRKLNALVRLLARDGVPVTELLRAYRQYLVTNQVNRCSYLVEIEKRVTRMPILNYVGAFNSLVEELSNSGAIAPGGVPPIKEMRITVDSTVNRPAPNAVFVSSEARDVDRAVATFAEHKLIERENIESSAGHRENGANPMAKEATALITRVEEYARVLIRSRTDAPDKALLEFAHLFRMLLESLDDPALQEKTAEAYTRSIGATWRLGRSASLCYAYLRELLLRCWTGGAGAKALEEARLRGVQQGLAGQEATMLKVAELTKRFEQGRESCRQ